MITDVNEMRIDMRKRIIDVYELAIEIDIDGAIMYHLFSEKKNFNKLFILISEKNYASHCNKEKMFKAVDYSSEYLYEDEEHRNLLSWLRQMTLISYCEEMKFKAYENRNCNISESEYNKWIVSNFENIFPEYEFVKSEFTITVGRIDILALDKETKRDVIMELKIGGRSVVHQLKSYSTCFVNPILVSVSTSEPLSKRDDIIYKVISPSDNLSELQT